MHPDLTGKALLISGHHKFRWSGGKDDQTPYEQEGSEKIHKLVHHAGNVKGDGERIIMDISGGKNEQSLEALILPTREIITSQNNQANL